MCARVFACVYACVIVCVYVFVLACVRVCVYACACVLLCFFALTSPSSSVVVSIPKACTHLLCCSVLQITTFFPPFFVTILHASAPIPPQPPHMYYSFDMGSIHVAMLSTEHAFETGSPQWQWLQVWLNYPLRAFVRVRRMSHCFRLSVRPRLCRPQRHALAVGHGSSTHVSRKY